LNTNHFFSTRVFTCTREDTHTRKDTDTQSGLSCMQTTRRIATKTERNIEIKHKIWLSTEKLGK